MARKHTDPNCEFCRKYSNKGMKPSHEASPRCKSGKREHCTCDICF